jgi:hypothetical protein
MKGKGDVPALTDYEEQIRKVAFDASLEGKSVLDIGSARLCIDALERGASRAVALELNRKQLRQAKNIADSAGVFPEFLSANVESAELGSFDIILLFNALEKLRDPIGVLRKLALGTRERLVIEAASLDVDGNRAPGGFREWFKRSPFRALGAYPFAYVGPNSATNREQNFNFTAPALHCLLDGHMRLFQRVEDFPSRHAGRFLLRCTRLKIDRLVVVSGVNSSGKSTLCEALARNELTDDIGIPDLSKAVFSAPSRLREGPTDAIFLQSETPLGIFHYDISSVDNRGLNHYARDPSTDLLRCAAQIDFVIVAPTEETLKTQLAKSGKNRHMGLFGAGYLSQRYADWIEFCSSIPATSRFLIYKEAEGTRRLAPQTSKADALAEIHRLYD